MREIKFRAWDRETKVMVYQTEENMVHLHLGPMGGWTMTNLEGEFGRPTGICVFGGVLMQYTGLKDKNGKEIYEGDIVRSGDIEMGLERTGIVKFGQGTFDGGIYKFQGWHCGEDHDAQDVLLSEDVVVIGNIYENQELLGK